MPERIRIVHVSDLHLEPAGEEQYAGLADRLGRITEVIAGLDPDLVVATGDLTNRGASIPEHFLLAERWLAGLGAPYLALPGNHDLGANRARGLSAPLHERYEEGAYSDSGFAAVFGREAVVRREAGSLTIIGFALREHDVDGVLDRIDGMLETIDGPVLLAGHYPFVDTRVWGSDEPFGATGYIDAVASRAAGLIARRPQVIAYLCGHVHLTSARPIGKRCLQLTAGGLGPGAAALRIYDWDGETLSFSTLDTEGPRVFWESGIEAARADPYFSQGLDGEREGIWPPRFIGSGSEDKELT
ncbi:MAG: metallophosphoesterase [Microbacterium sp.]